MTPYLTFVAEAYKHVVIPEITDDIFIALSRYTVGWTVFFLCFHYSADYMIHQFAYLHRKLDVKKKTELAGYITGLVHHVVISPMCLYCIIDDYLMFHQSGGQAFPTDHYTTLYSAMGLFPFTFGYFVADMIVYAGPEALKPGLTSKIFLIHHAVAISMLYSVYTLAQGVLTQIFVGMMCTELSTVFFNGAWVLRAYGYRDSQLVGFLEKMFAFIFLLLRNVHLTILVYVLWNDLHRFGVYQLSILVSIVLQYFWASKILFSVRTASSKSEKKEGKKVV